jgi:hypothetical protein
VGPLVGDDSATDLIAQLEDAGLVYHDDFVEIPGQWPGWLRLFAMDAPQG